MIDLLLRIGVSNLCLSAALAVVAWAVHRRGTRPHVAHLLWLLVLAQLITPPLFTVPMVTVPGQVVAEQPPPELAPGLAGALTWSELDALAAEDLPSATALALEPHSSVERTKTSLILLWLLGSLGILAWSLARILRFHRLLGMSSEPAPPSLQALAAELARCLGLRTAPLLLTTSAEMSPLVWWVGGRARVVLPASMTRELKPDELRWILAHELAHLRRRDHLVRWLEWLACVAFWWNPVTWWARRNLRSNEEVCCDALVLASLRPDPRTYATSLLSAVELLAAPALRPPAMASGIHGGGSLQRRFTMILSGKTPPKPHRVLRALALPCTVGLLSLGIVHAQDASSADRATRERSPQAANADEAKALRARIASGELTEAAARVLYDKATPPEWALLRYAAGAEGIDARVASDELTAEEASVQKAELGRALQSIAFSMEVLGKSLVEARVAHAVEAGTLSAEEAAQIVARLEREAAAVKERIAKALSERGFEREQIGGTLRVFDRIVDEVRLEGERFELDPETNKLLTERLRLTDEQVELVVGLARRMAGGRQEASAPPDWVATVLAERGGLTREQIGGVLGALERIVPEIQREGEGFELDPGMRDYLSTTLGLTAEQIDLVLGVARRVAATPDREDSTGRGEDRDREESTGTPDWVPTVLSERGGLDREQIGAVVPALGRIVAEIQSEGEDFELNARMSDYLSMKVGLTAEQIELVVGVARRLAVR